MENVNLLFDQEIHLGLDLAGHRLVPGYQGEVGLPFEAFLQLYAVKDDTNVKLITAPGDLSPIVSAIRTAEEAWRFLRLFTAPTTHYLFQKELYTIDLQVSTPADPPAFGMISEKVAGQIGYQPPEINYVNHTYTTRRDLVRVNAQRRSAAPILIRRRETLADDGAYRLLDDEVIRKFKRKDVFLPSYE